MFTRLRRLFYRPPTPEQTRQVSPELYLGLELEKLRPYIALIAGAPIRLSQLWGKTVFPLYANDGRPSTSYAAALEVDTDHPRILMIDNPCPLGVYSFEIDSANCKAQLVTAMKSFAVVVNEWISKEEKRVNESTMASH